MEKRNGSAKNAQRFMQSNRIGKLILRHAVLGSIGVIVEPFSPVGFVCGCSYLRAVSFCMEYCLSESINALAGCMEMDNSILIRSV